MRHARACAVGIFLIFSLVLSKPSTATSSTTTSTTTRPRCATPYSQPPDSTYEERLAFCGASGMVKKTVEEAYIEAHRFAPHLYYHPMEQILLTKVEDFLDASSIFWENGSYYGEATEYNLLAVQDSGLASQTYLSQNGTNINTTYTPNAPIYFNVVDNSTDRFNSTFIYNFFMFYTENGCATQQLFIGTNSGDQYIYDFTSCDLGKHEGDWESVNVEVCGDLSKVITVSYGEHDFAQQFHCFEDFDHNYTSYVNNSASWVYWDKYLLNYTETSVSSDSIGQCKFYTGTQNPLGFISLGSHAVYPFAAPETVYAQVQDVNYFIANLEAINLVDRTIPDVNRSVVPTSSNVIPLYNNSLVHNRASLILSTNNQSVARDPSIRTWVLYPGGYGGATYEKVRDPLCFAPGQVAYEECPSLVWTNTLKAILGLADSNQAQISKLSSDFEKYTRVRGPTGPIAKRYWSGLYGIEASLLFTESTIACPDPERLKEGYPVGTKFLNKDQSGAGFGLAGIGLSVFVIVFMLLTLVGLRSRGHYHKTHHDDVNVTAAPHGPTPKKLGRKVSTLQSSFERFLFRISTNVPMLSVCAFILFACGTAVMIPGIQSMLTLTDATLPGLNVYEHIADLLYVGIALACFFNFLGLLHALGLRMGLMALWYAVNGGRDGFWCRLILNKNYQFVAQVILTVIYCSALISVLYFGVAMIVVGFRVVILQSCNIIKNQDIGLCINLSQFGGSDICGEDITDFCNSWSTSNTWILGIGALLFCLGTLLILIAISQNEETSHWIQLYESRYIRLHKEAITNWKKKFYAEKWRQISAVATRLQQLEDEVSELKQELEEKDAAAAGLVTLRNPHYRVSDDEVTLRTRRPSSNTSFFNRVSRLYNDIFHRNSEARRPSTELVDIEEVTAGGRTPRTKRQKVVDQAEEHKRSASADFLVSQMKPRKQSVFRKFFRNRTDAAPSSNFEDFNVEELGRLSPSQVYTPLSLEPGASPFKEVGSPTLTFSDHVADTQLPNQIPSNDPSLPVFPHRPPPLSTFLHNEMNSSSKSMTPLLGDPSYLGEPDENIADDLADLRHLSPRRLTSDNALFIGSLHSKFE